MERLKQLRIVWRYRWWLLALSIIVVVGTYLVSSSREDTYRAEATSQIILGEGSPNDLPTDDQVLRLTNIYQRIASSSQVYERAARDNRRLGTEADFRNSTVVDSEGEIGVLVPAAEDRDPQRAADLANAYATAIAEHVDQVQSRERQRTLSRITRQIDDVERRLATRERATRNDDSAQGTDPQLLALQSQLASLQSSAADATVAPRERVRVIERAAVPTEPASPKPARDAVLALLAFMLFGTAAAYLAYAFGDRYDGPVDAATDLNLPLLGELPRGAADEPRTVEALRLLRTNVQFALTSGPDAGSPSSANGHSEGGERSLASAGMAPALLVTGPERGAGKSFVTANLARAFLADGRRVAAIDGDLRKPTLASQLMVPEEPGLGDLLSSNAYELTDVIFQVPQSPVVARRGGDLNVLAAGTMVEDPVEALSSARMGAVLGELRRIYDLLILDSPPAVGVVDPVVLARGVQGIILVVDAKRSRRWRTRRAVHSLRASGTPVLGFVFNRAARSDTAYIDYRRVPSSAGSESEVKS